MRGVEVERKSVVMEQWMMYALAGLAMGLLSGAFGVGGGIVMVPALVLIFGMDQHAAQGMSLAAMVPIAIAGALGYMFKSGFTLDWRVALLIGVAGVVGSLGGTYLAHQLPGHVLRKAFAVFMVPVAVLLFFRDDLLKPRATSDGPSTTAGASSGSHPSPSEGRREGAHDAREGQ